MSRDRAIFVAVFFALCLPARAQTIIFLPRMDHNWVVHYRTQTYGLIQYTDDHYHPKPFTYTSVCFGSRSFDLNMSVWPILAALVSILVCLGWIIVYGIGFISKTTEKPPPPPNPSPPP
jgi:hypothetical protein